MTTVAGVPTQLALMLREPDFDTFDLVGVRFIIVGGGPVTPGLAREARARFGAALATRYSCTEAGIGLGTAFDDPEEDAVVSVGRPHPSVELALLDDDDRPVAAGEVGEVCLRSPAVMSRLLARPRRRPRPRSPPTGSCAPATSAGSTTAAGSGSSAAARRCTCAAATTCTRSRSRRCSRRIPRWPRSRSCPRADA